jgi:prepilin-type N-terminal cleavage/methylation domain-containing protein
MRKHSGFTLVELVVVVMILGILAAVAAPKLLNTSGAATDNGVKQTLAVIRDAIERYAAENGGALPGLDGDQDTFKTNLTEYLRGPFPVCPVGPAGTTNANVKMTIIDGPIIGEPAPGESWHYSTKTGQFIINWDEDTKSDPTVQYDAL